MITDSTPAVTLTWKQFNLILTQLGYVRHLTEREQIYEEPATETLLIFPRQSESDNVARHHLYMARMNTALKGVAEEAEFDRVLYQVLDPVSSPTPSKPLV